MAIDAAYDIIHDAFIGWIPFNMTWALSLLLTFLTLLLVCGLNTQKWKENALPILTGWNIAGVPTHWLLYIILSIIYVTEHISITQLSEITTLATRRTTEWVNQAYWKPRQENRLREKQWNEQKIQKKHKELEKLKAGESYLTKKAREIIAKTEQRDFTPKKPFEQPIIVDYDGRPIKTQSPYVKIDKKKLFREEFNTKKTLQDHLDSFSKPDFKIYNKSSIKRHIFGGEEPILSKHSKDRKKARKYYKNN